RARVADRGGQVRTARIGPPRIRGWWCGTGGRSRGTGRRTGRTRRGGRRSRDVPQTEAVGEEQASKLARGEPADERGALVEHARSEPDSGQVSAEEGSGDAKLS